MSARLRSVFWETYLVFRAQNTKYKIRIPVQCLFFCLVFFQLAVTPARAYVWDFCLQDQKVGGQTVKGYEAQALPCLGICAAEINNNHTTAELTNLCDACPAIISGIADSKLPWIAAPLKAQALTLAASLKAGCSAKLLLQKTTEAMCDKGPLGCCIYVEKEAGADGKGKIEREECPTRGKIYYGDCYCRVGETIHIEAQRQTFDLCKQRCEKIPGRIDLNQGIGRYQATEGSGYPQELEFVNATCFKPEDCADQKGIFGGADSACIAGQGKCYAPEPLIKLSSPIFGAAEVKGIRGYIEVMVRYGMAIVGIFAAVMFIFGGFKYLMGATLTSIKSGKQTMFNATIGMFLVLLSVTLLKTVNPESGRFDQLRVVMINKQQFALMQWCRDFKPASASKPVKFGFSGDPAGQFAYTEVKFDKALADTECGKEYYPEGFIGRRCDGSVCAEKGKVCMPCKLGFKECGAKKTGNACVKIVLGGNIQFKDGREPKEVTAMAVCNWAQVAQGQPHGYSKMKDAVPEFKDAALQGDGGKMGNKAFMLGLTQDDLSKLQQSCAAKGGLRGVLLGVIYYDTERGGTGAAAAGATVGAAYGFATPIPGGTLLGAAAGGTVGYLGGGFNDALIVTKKDCGNAGQTRYKGYADGGVSDHGDMTEALYCGSVVVPGQGSVANQTDIIFPDAMWSASELSQAIAGDKPIECNFALSDTSAPSDPTAKLMSKCDDKYCAPGDPDCNK